MSTALSHQASEISKKRKYAKQVCPTKEMYSEMWEQIAICEHLGKPITETQIHEWSKLTIQGMLRKVHALKFA